MSKRVKIQRLKRIDNWPSLLEQELQARMRRKFEWGQQDCCTFASALVAAMTGVNIARMFGPYKSQVGAARILKRVGGVIGLMQRVAERFQLTQLPGVLYARRGDVCLIKTADGDALGICIGASVAGAGVDGVELVPLNSAMRAWRIE